MTSSKVGGKQVAAAKKILFNVQVLSKVKDLVELKVEYIKGEKKQIITFDFNLKTDTSDGVSSEMKRSLHLDHNSQKKIKAKIEEALRPVVSKIRQENRHANELSSHFKKLAENIEIFFAGM